ncbi:MULTISPECIES: PP2C family serine/threonine-protein phosphatase [unclassified Duganella]|uniref:PP2C family protein-serine/threonine phosphatase n=1 Tax=unclassified Duganella TaxID=2636909 RepID=UPI0008814559|nr:MULTISPECIES: protein phosphatase 2C domain-containing protein [unclassified Duganella]SDF44179.1 Serine/threonine protein phosphatase PrpC [Duganella sp. OV458]SDI82550.1 Serine/threonine protein phosphatase PrpC [Duganella sp. OV510]
MSHYKIEAGTAQHAGSRPQQNDRVALFTAAQAPGYVLAVLADGNHNAVAPDQVLLTSKHLFDEFRASDSSSLPRLQQLLRDIAQEAHHVIKMNPIAASAEPHSALALLVLTPQAQAVWAHVGDARIYRFSGEACTMRTNDAEYIAHLVEHDKLPLEAAKKHRGARLLNNALGNSMKDPFVSFGTHEGLQAGDALMLCSDGLWQWFRPEELAAAVARNTPRQAAERLIAKAGERAQGKGDNCSMAIIKLLAPGARAARAV